MESNIQHNNTGMVSLESICLQRNNLQLNVFVQNVSFEKKVTMRYTTDQWKTFHEIDFEYQLSLFERDRFSLVFPLPRFQQRFHMEFSIRYQSNGLEFWDNNQEKNFCVELTRKSRTKEQPSGFQIQKGRQCQRSIFKDF
ncbi:putative phosphatase regulatory subunit-domain-containing protein [Gorgonomyces haynaldii]|nr:putative phosphatase regulatory subunit-domain-containing protein [Gorgonomyces haynaldii]